MAAGPPQERLTLRSRLERHGLERRERRLELVVAELRDRADASRPSKGSVPAPLGRALVDVESQLDAVRARMRRRSLGT